MNFFLGTANKPRKVLLDQLRVLCRMAVRGVLAFYNDQTQAKESGQFFLKNRQLCLDTAGVMVV